jgi:branched-chain amino acid transport system substrate-binding protein
MERIGRLLRIAAVLVVAGSLLGITAPRQSVAGEPIIIGAAAPLTGARALLGRNFRQGVNLALEEINGAGGVLGRPLQVVFEDDQGDNPNAAINAVNRLIHVDKVPLMMGPHYSVAQMATQKLYWEAKVISTTGASGVPVTAQGNPYVFRVRMNDILVGKALVAYARDTLKATKIAIHYINDDFGKGGMERVVKGLEEFQMKPVAVESHNAGDKDFTAQLSKIIQAGAQVMVMWSHDTESALVVRQVKQLSPTLKVIGTTSLSEPSFLRLAGEAADGVISANDFVPSNPDPRIQAFVAKYQAKYNMGPEVWAAAYYDATHIAAKVIAAAGGTDTEKLRQAFFALRYTGLLADFRFDPNGDGNHQIHMVEDSKGEAKWVSTVKF